MTDNVENTPDRLTDILARIPTIEFKVEAPVITLLTERERTHGLYRQTAAMSQGLKAMMATGKNWATMNSGQREALELIALKIARILSGDPNFRDHWDDIGGYAPLGADSAPTQLPRVQADIAQSISQ